MKILLVEDEEDLNNLISKGLRKSGYAVDSAFDGEEALYLHSVNEYDLMILDLNLPKIDGLEALETIRKTDLKTKVIILSARSKIDERVVGLDLGANDYLVKPFDFKELEARIRTLLRMNFVQRESVICCGYLKLNSITKKAEGKDSQIIEFTKKEYAIAEYLLVNKGQVISAETLIEHVWDSEADLFSNSLKYHIHSVKKKVKEACEGCEYIKNLRGQGYVITEEEDEANA